MTENDLLKILNSLASNKISISEAVTKLKEGPFKSDNFGHYTLDYHRSLRHGIAEVIFAEPKTTEQVLEIANKLSNVEHPVLFTRLTGEQAEILKKNFPKEHLNKIGRTFIFNAPAKKDIDLKKPYVALFSAGTSDAPVIEEASDVCLAMNIPYKMVNDVGVSGIHRTLQHIDLIQNATAIVVVAGMEGALPSVIGGLSDAPIFAVPTSVGYGASFNGISALLGMLNSCASGVTVSNIDNGFSAAFSACMVVRKVQQAMKLD